MDFDLFDEFATDTKKELEGTWLPLTGDPDGPSLLIARTGNKSYAKLLSQLYSRHKALLEGASEAALAKSDEIMRTVISQTILLGWRGVKYKGELVQYSHANAAEFLKMGEFRRKVMELADDVNNFKLVEEKEQGEA